MGQSGPYVLRSAASMDEQARLDTAETASVRMPRADAQRSRERILSAAGFLFERDPGATMTEVAAAAGVGRSTLHRHFSSRRELWRALAASEPGGAAPSTRSELAVPDRSGRAGAPALEALDVLDRVPAHLVAEQLVAEARRLAGVPVALYLVDVDGSGLLWLAGDAEHLPAWIELRLGLGPEIAPDALPELYAYLESRLPGCLPTPLWLRGRATGILLAVGTPREPLAEIARQGAAALELANRYTDDFDALRRRRPTSAAAEVQLALLPCARVVRVPGGELAGGLLPGPQIGGDWFDWADNRYGTWVAIADPQGDGAVAAGRAAISLGALRAARRRGLDLPGAALAVDELVGGLVDPFPVAAVIAHWQAAVSVLRWVRCGHSPPLLIGVDGSVDELVGEQDRALGLGPGEAAFRVHRRRLEPGERVIVCSDGLLERRADDGVRFGLAGIRAAVRGEGSTSAAGTARAVQTAVVGASARPLEDDVAVVVLAVA